MEVRALLDLGDVAKATRKLDDLAERVGWRWRLIWYRAVAELLTGDYDSAIKHFTEVLDTFPGELAPKMAWPPRPNWPATPTSTNSTRRCGAPTTA